MSPSRKQVTTLKLVDIGKYKFVGKIVSELDCGRFENAGLARVQSSVHVEG